MERNSLNEINCGEIHDDGDGMDIESISSYLAQQLQDFGEMSLSYLSETPFNDVVASAPNALSLYDSLDFDGRATSSIFGDVAFEDDETELLRLLSLNRNYQSKLREQLGLVEDGLKMNRELQRWLRPLLTKHHRKRNARTELGRLLAEMEEDDSLTKAHSKRVKAVLDEYQKFYLQHFRFSEGEQKELARAIRYQNQNLFLDGFIEEAAKRGEAKEDSLRASMRQVQRMSQRELETNLIGINWSKVAAMVGDRSDIDCRIQWLSQQHPLINHSSFSKTELEALESLVQKHGCGGRWAEIAQDLNTNRTAWQCLAAYHTALKGGKASSSAAGKWTKEEDESLMKAVLMYGEKDAWRDIEESMDGRTAAQCLHRWVKALDPRKKAGRWTLEEDEWLLAGVRRFGSGINWALMQEFVPNRTDVQCRERYMNVLHPRLRKEEFTPEEDARLLETVTELGEGKWSQVASVMNDRTDNQCRRRWLYLQKIHGHSSTSVLDSPIATNPHTVRDRPKRGRPRRSQG